VFSENFRNEIPGADKHPEYWASGISLVAHAANPRAPSAHMNTRMIITGNGARIWFGGGGDLNPAIAYDDDTRAFHDAFRTICDPVDSEYYTLFSEWCDAYFTLPHRNMTRGVGGIFYDYLGVNHLGSDTTPIAGGRFGKGGLNDTRVARGMEKAAGASLNWQEALNYTKSVGETFRDSYSALMRARMFTPHTPEDRHTQLVYRGRYAEYNLLYDRGTRFGLMTGGNTDAILMSLPPLAVWE
jgi:coproporphyrinogen III oxidase